MGHGRVRLPMVLSSFLVGRLQQGSLKLPKLLYSDKWKSGLSEKRKALTKVGLAWSRHRRHPPRR